jgi:hypothetical protein
VVDVETARARLERDHDRREARDAQRRARGLPHEILGILERGKPGHRASEPLSRLDAGLRATQLLDAAPEQIGAALELAAYVVAEHGRRLDVERPDDASAGAQRHAQLGDDGRHRREELGMVRRVGHVGH